MTPKFNVLQKIMKDLYIVGIVSVIILILVMTSCRESFTADQESRGAMIVQLLNNQVSQNKSDFKAYLDFLVKTGSPYNGLETVSTYYILHDLAKNKKLTVSDVASRMTF